LCHLADKRIPERADRRRKIAACGPCAIEQFRNKLGARVRRAQPRPSRACTSMPALVQHGEYACDGLGVRAGRPAREILQLEPRFAVGDLVCAMAGRYADTYYRRDLAVEPHLRAERLEHMRDRADDRSRAVLHEHQAMIAAARGAPEATRQAKYRSGPRSPSHNSGRGAWPAASAAQVDREHIDRARHYPWA